MNEAEVSVGQRRDEGKQKRGLERKEGRLKGQRAGNQIH